jgi:hypothetical protein
MGVLLSIWGFAKSPLGRYVIGGLAVLALLAGVRAHFIHQGKLEAQQEASQQIATETEKARELARQDAAAKISEADKREEQAQAAIDAATERERIQAATIQALASQRATMAAQVKALSDSELHAFTIRTLNLRAPGEMNACYTAAEERAIADRVQDDPKCQDQLKAEDGRIAELNTKFDALAGKVDAMQQKYDALSGYTVALEKDYTDLYNEIPRKRNLLLTVATFGFAGKPKKLKAPDPATLLKGKP